MNRMPRMIGAHPTNTTEVAAVIATPRTKSTTPARTPAEMRGNDVLAGVAYI
jgi:hypothetical protein